MKKKVPVMAMANAQVIGKMPDNVAALTRKSPLPMRAPTGGSMSRRQRMMSASSLKR